MDIACPKYNHYNSNIKSRRGNYKIRLFCNSDKGSTINQVHRFRLNAYLKFDNSDVPSTSTNITDSSNTVRYHALDTNINTNSILMGANLNDIKIIPFISYYSLYLSSTIPNLPGSEVNFIFIFDHQIVSSNLLKMKVTIQPSITMS
jgi:hypothetical protein